LQKTKTNQQIADCRKRKAMNLTQEILLKEGKMLPVMEHFYTLQGEGAHTGKSGC
jgi:hypothetical protein